MSDVLVQIDGAPRPPIDRREVVRIALNLAAVCAVSAAILGGVYVATERHEASARMARERRAVTDLLALGDDARVIEIQQFLAPASREVVYRVGAAGEDAAAAREIVFTLEGERRPATAVLPARPDRVPLGRLFVAEQGGRPAGFVIEGESPGYKNQIRFFVALDTTFTIQGVRVVQHEEDPGLGAEIATAWFQGQFLGRGPRALATLDVTRTPLPEDWRAALELLGTQSAGAWRESHAELIEREGREPIHAVTGATISSRALTQGVRISVEHFRRRWALLAPELESAR